MGVEVGIGIGGRIGTSGMLASSTSIDAFPCPLGVHGLAVVELVPDGILIFDNTALSHIALSRNSHTHQEDHNTSHTSTPPELDGGRIHEVNQEAAWMTRVDLRTMGLMQRG